MSDQYGWKIILDGTTNITSKVKSFSIDNSLESFCRELSLELSDEELFDTFDFSTIGGIPRIEVFTRIVELDEYTEDEYDPAWISQGDYFIERPVFTNSVGEAILGLWGRQSTAVLNEPFAQKVTKLWEVETTFYQVAREILESVGLVWYPALCELQDYTILADNFEADDQYPIDTLKELVTLFVGEEGFVTTDRLGRICIKRITRFPVTADHSIVDLDVQTISEEAYWPEFGNRIKISPAETVSQNVINLSLEDDCLSTDGSIKAIAQILDGEGVGINGSVVDWLFTNPTIPKDIWYKYPGYPGNMTKMATMNTARVLITNEIVTAQNYTTIETKYVPETIVGIWAKSDVFRSTNFAAGGNSIDKKTVTIIGDTFDYYDQTLVVSYYASGIVEEIINCSVQTYESPLAVDVLGEVVIVVEAYGKSAQKQIFVNNQSKCPLRLYLSARPSTIVCTTVSREKSIIYAYVEFSSKGMDNVRIKFKQDYTKAMLSFYEMYTSTVLITKEPSQVINTVPGRSQCTLGTEINSVIGVYQLDSEGKRIGSNLYSSFSGRTIDLTVHLDTNTNLEVDYYRPGSARLEFIPTSTDSKGTARVTGTITGNSEKDIEAYVDVIMTDNGGIGGTPTTTIPEADGYPIQAHVDGPSFEMFESDNPVGVCDTLLGPFVLVGIQNKYEQARPVYDQTTSVSFTVLLDSVDVDYVPEVSVVGNYIRTIHPKRGWLHIQYRVTCTGNYHTGPGGSDEPVGTRWIEVEGHHFLNHTGTFGTPLLEPPETFSIAGTPQNVRHVFYDNVNIDTAGPFSFVGSKLTVPTNRVLTVTSVEQLHDGAITYVLEVIQRATDDIVKLTCTGKGSIWLILTLHYSATNPNDGSTLTEQSNGFDVSIRMDVV